VILIDPEGRRLAGLPPGDAGVPAWPVPHPNGAEGGDPQSDPAALAVHDLGFIEVSSVRDGVQIRVRPLLVSGPAATQLFFALADMRPSRVVLVRFDDDRRQWRHEICGHWRNALERMNALVFANERLPSYLAAELDLAELETQPEQGLHELRRLWERSNRRLENGAAEALAGLALHEQSLLVAADPPGDALRIVRLGANLHFYGREWTGSATGRALADQPDGVFAARIEANLRRSIALARPLFHRVEATVRRSSRTAVQVSYRRLVLPWRMADGRRGATSTVLLDQFIEIAG
jgi:hypothetical protein